MLLTETDLIFRGIRPLQRLKASARNLTFTNPFAGMARVPHCLRNVPPDPWPGDAQHGRDMVAGIFHFAGQTIERGQLSWEPAEAHPEWISALHGFEWLRDLRSVGGERARRMARDMVALWIAQYPKFNDLTWRVDILGARLASWIAFHDFFCASADEAFRRNYFSSLISQARYLSRRLPGNQAGLPLMRALRGLAYTGVALEGGDACLEQAFKMIMGQLVEQILPDGGHVSRSPQATFEFLQCLVDLRAALIAAKMEMPEEVQDAIDRIAPAVKFFRHGDGALAQFNGGQEGNAHLCETTLMHSGSRGRPPKSLPHCGYERISLGRSSLIMDTGLPLESKYDDRAHAGLLSFEYSFGRERVFVNCGTSEAEGKWRRVLRSTLAHSALAVDNRNSCPVGGEGRFSTRPLVNARRQDDESGTVIAASHNGYVPRFGLTHHRYVRLQEQGDELCGEDQLIGKSGAPFAVRFHLHPGIEVVTGEDEILLRSKGGIQWAFRAFGIRMGIEESIYVSAGENPQPTHQIVLSGQTVGSATSVGWKMRRLS